MSLRARLQRRLTLPRSLPAIGPAVRRLLAEVPRRVRGLTPGRWADLLPGGPRSRWPQRLSGSLSGKLPITFTHRLPWLDADADSEAGPASGPQRDPGPRAPGRDLAPPRRHRWLAPSPLRRTDAGPAKPADPELPRSSDPVFPFFTFSEAARLRRLVRTAFAERGIECSIEGSQLVDAAGNRYGLWNLAAALSELPREEWRDVVENHVRVVLTQPSLIKLPVEEVLSSLKLRLVDLESVPFVEDLPHVRALAPGLVEILTLDLPDSVITPPAVDLTRVGPVDSLIRAGRDNLVAIIDSDIQTRHVRTDEGLTFDFAYGDSFFVASLALALPQLMTALEPSSSLAKGVFVAIPNRHHLAWRVVDDLPSLLAVGPMAGFARNGYDDGAGPVSPHVFWVRGQVWEQLTQHRDDEIAIHVSPELTALVEED